ncbi:MAG: hypothetical protein ACO2O4_00380 [Minisyncoccia bacterium]|jgi:hypothetical protein
MTDRVEFDYDVIKNEDFDKYQDIKLYRKIIKDHLSKLLDLDLTTKVEIEWCNDSNCIDNILINNSKFKRKLKKLIKEIVDSLKNFR